jgi:hypothetical protein
MVSQSDLLLCALCEALSVLCGCNRFTAEDRRVGSQSRAEGGATITQRPWLCWKVMRVRFAASPKALLVSWRSRESALRRFRE